MAEQVVINIVRPEVGVFYQPESVEAEPADQLAACELGLHALAQRILVLRSAMGMEHPELVKRLADSQYWRLGM